MKRIVVLGATGSIGTQTLEVATDCPDAVELVGLSAHTRWQLLFEQARQFRPAWVAVTDESLRDEVDGSALGRSTRLVWGEAGVERMVTDQSTDLVVAAMVGSAGLRSTVAALQAGKDIALANKETLVVGGPIVTELARRQRCQLLPVDSEHSAIFQCLRAGHSNEVARVVLTASGGPFRTRPLDQFDSIRVDDALRHPTWRMGTKITIDSATMMNKALEIIEAHWLFGLSAEQIGVAIHPQSMVHSMVEFVDGSVIAQVSPPDMRLPILNALTHPRRQKGPARKVDWSQSQSWEFSPPDLERFPALELGYKVVRQRGTSGAALNAANEVAVARFLEGSLAFTEIVPCCRDVLENHPFDPSPSLSDLERVDRWSRTEAHRWTSFPVSSTACSS